MSSRGVAVLTICCSLGVAGCSTEATKQRYFERGEQYLAANQYSEAIIEFRNAVQRDELWGEARLKLAEAYAAKGDPSLAYREYIRAADLLPDNVPAQMKAAAYLLLAGQFEDARARAERVLAKQPDNAEAQVAYGNALVGLRDLDGAVTQIAEAIQLDPARSQSYVSLARVRMAQGREADARAAFDRAIAADPRSIAALLGRANFEWSTGNLAEAEKSLKRVLEIEPDNVLTHRVLATMYVTSGRPADAEEHLRMVAKLAGTDAARLALADYYISRERPADARTVLLPLTALPTSSAAARTRLARLAYDESHAEGHRLVDEVLAAEPNNVGALILKAQWLLGEGQPEQALARAQTALTVSPHLVTALYIQAEAQARTRRTGEAITTLIDILRVNPRDADAQTQLSALYLSRNEPDAAVHAAEEALSNDSDSIGARLALARALIARGDLKNANAELTKLKTRASDNPLVYVVEATGKMRSNDLKGARASFERALALDRSLRETIIGLTTVDMLLGNTAQARSRVDSGLRSSSDPELLRLAARVLIASGDAGAEDVLRRAIAADPLDCEAPALLARLLTQSGRLEASLAGFEDALRRDADDLPARVMTALLVHTQGKLGEAKAQYVDILKREPRLALAANNLAAIYTDEGENLNEAQGLAERATELFPNHAGMRDTLGGVFLKRQLSGPALNHFQRSVDTEPTNPVYVYHLGLAYAQSGDKGRAAAAFRRSLQLSPGFAPAKQALGALGMPAAAPAKR